jgi:hypothetical protein
MNPKLEKFAYKQGIGLVFAAVLGGLVKLNYKIDDRIDAKYEEKKKEAEYPYSR